MKICLVGVALFHAGGRKDGQTDMAKLTVVFFSHICERTLSIPSSVTHFKNLTICITLEVQTTLSRIVLDLLLINYKQKDTWTHTSSSVACLHYVHVFFTYLHK
jgi:hypothetical protein